MTIYLLHFHTPLHHAQHYLGYAADLETRLAQHRAGQGARLAQVFIEHGIGFELARTWIGGREPERRLKDRHNGRRLCPLCNVGQEG